MRLIISAFLLLSFFSGNLLAQNSLEAEKILASVANRYAVHNAFEGEFSMKIENEEAGISDEQDGTFLVSGEKYFLETETVDRITNGETVWTVFKEDEEVQITDFDEEEEEFNPSTIFNFYQKGFTYPDIRDSIVNEIPSQIIDLFPNDSQASYNKVSLIIMDRNGAYIHSGIVYSKNGTKITYTLPKINVYDIAKFKQQKIAQKFIFDEGNYEGLDLDSIDLR